MSVTKAGTDDHNCGITNNDSLHQAICRVVAGRHHGRRRGRQRQRTTPPTNIPASYNEVITVSALADTDGKPGGLGGNRCYSWGGYDKDDTFAELQQLRRRRRPHRAGQVHLVDRCPGRATATCRGRRWRPRPSPAPSRSTRRAARTRRRPRSARRSATSATSTGRPRPTRTPTTSRCSTCRGSGRSGRSTLDAGGAGRARSRPAATTAVPITLARSATFFERVTLSVTSLPDRLDRRRSAPTSLLGLDRERDDAHASTVPEPARRPGTYQHRRHGHEPGPDRDTTTVDRRRRERRRPRRPPHAALVRRHGSGTTTVPVRVSLGRRRPTRRARSPATRSSRAATAARGARPIARRASVRAIAATRSRSTRTYEFRVRARDARRQLEPVGRVAEPDPRVRPSTTAARRSRYTASWTRTTSSSPAFDDTLHRLAAKRRGRSATLHRPRHRASSRPTGPGRGKAQVYIDGVLHQDHQPAASADAPAAGSSSRAASRRAARTRITLKIASSAGPGRRVPRREVARSTASGPCTRLHADAVAAVARLAPVRYGDRPDAPGRGPAGDRREA